MAKEIERKFLVDRKLWKPQGTKEKIIQCYLSVDKNRIVRVRTKGAKAFITIKGKMTGISRDEFEYEIPISDAHELIKLGLNKPIIKTRYSIVFEEKIWEVDVFEEDNDGLIIAEIELINPDDSFIKPNWICTEVSTDPRYSNSMLSQNPFSNWQ